MDVYLLVRKGESGSQGLKEKGSRVKTKSNRTSRWCLEGEAF